MKKANRRLALIISLVMVVGLVLPMISPVTASATTRDVRSSGDLEAVLLAGLNDGDIINVLATFTFEEVFAITGMEITIALNTHTLNIV